MSAAAEHTHAVEAIIFDLDGTLIDYEGASHTALARPLERRGRELPWSLHARIIGTKPEDWSRTIVEACAFGADELTPAQYAAEYFAEIDGLYEAIEAWPGTLPLLRRLRARGFPLAIATSSPRSSFDRKMVHHPEILRSMDAVVTGDEVERGKPAPDIFLEAARRLGSQASRCVVFEDSPLGLQASRTTSGAASSGVYRAGRAVAQRAPCAAAGRQGGGLPDRSAARQPHAEQHSALPGTPFARSMRARLCADAALHARQDLEPTWLLCDGIGQFDPECLGLMPGSAVMSPENSTGPPR